MNNITLFDLQKVMVRAYQDSNITSAFFDMLYDFLNRTTGVIKIKYDDAGKYIDVTTNRVDSLIFTQHIKELYAKFVINVLNTNSLEYLLSKDPNYNAIKKMRESDIFNMAVGIVSVLDINSGSENSIFRIKLVN